MTAQRRPPPVEEDARGIVDPDVLRETATLTRFPAGPVLAGLVDWFWAVEWRLPPGVVHAQAVLTHPGANLSVSVGEPREGAAVPGPVAATLHGVARRLSVRRLAGEGWAVAALTAPGGLGALVPGPAHRLTDRVVPLGPALGVDGDALVEQVCAQNGVERRVDVLRSALEEVLERSDPARVEAAREVAALARRAEDDRELRRVEQLAAVAGVTPRTLQRLFAEYAGVTPAWVLRRYRILDAAEAARSGDHVRWGPLAADLGYSDQAHLVRDFRRHLGDTPAAYAARQARLRMTG